MKTILSADEVQTLEGIQNSYAIEFAPAIVPATSKRLVEFGYVQAWGIVAETMFHGSYSTTTKARESLHERTNEQNRS